jgi:hypothetical protein
VRNQIDSFAGDTARLAQADDPQAKLVVDALRSQNIQIIRPPAAPAVQQRKRRTKTPDFVFAVKAPLAAPLHSQ